MPITDAFTGTNGNGLPTYSASWVYTRTGLGGSAGIQIQSNAFGNAGGGVPVCERTESGFPSNHYAQITIAGVQSGKYLGVSVRCQGPSTDSCYTYYGDSATSVVIELSTGGTTTQLGSTAGALAASSIVRLTASGTTLTPNINGSTTNTPGAQTDATYSNGTPGVACNGPGAVGTALADSFECSDVAPPPTITQQPSNQSVWVGDTATFTVAATTSDGTLIYDWEVNDGGGFVNAAGTQTNASYTTAVLTLAEGGDIYRCNVSDDNGAVTSASATLTVELAAALANFSGITPLTTFSSDTPSRFNI